MERINDVVLGCVDRPDENQSRLMSDSPVCQPTIRQTDWNAPWDCLLVSLWVSSRLSSLRLSLLVGPADRIAVPLSPCVFLQTIPSALACDRLDRSSIQEESKCPCARCCG